MQSCINFIPTNRCVFLSCVFIKTSVIREVRFTFAGVYVRLIAVEQGDSAYGVNRIVFNEFTV